MNLVILLARVTWELAISVVETLSLQAFAQLLLYVTQVPAQMSFVLEDCPDPSKIK